MFPIVDKMENLESQTNSSGSTSSCVVLNLPSSRTRAPMDSTSVPSPENEEQVKETTQLGTKPTARPVAAVAVPGGKAHAERSVMTKDLGKGNTKKPNDAADQDQWRRQVDYQLRQAMVDHLLQELQRLSGHTELQTLRKSATNFELLVWQKSTNLIEYRQKLEARIQSLRKQPPRQTINRTEDSTTDNDNDTSMNTRFKATTTADTSSSARSLASTSAGTRSLSPRALRKGGKRKMSARSSSTKEEMEARGSKRVRKTDGSFAAKSTASASALLSPPAPTNVTNWRGVHDQEYFARLAVMRDKYRDEVALVFRELSRVNGVIQHSPGLRPQGASPNNLGEFLVNLKKIISLLEQQPDEVYGMIPARKRTLEYLQVVENHIQHKVLPILQRLRATYSSLLRPLLLNHLKRFQSDAKYS